MGKDVLAAEKAIMKLSGLIRYQKSLRNKQKQENFLNHLRKYISMYQTDCPFEVSTTNRYTITTYEAAVTARRRIRQGEVIKYLTGTLVPLTTAESLNLDLNNRNFSIVVTGRKKSDHMFLGPARFANHDCDSNARLKPQGDDSMMVFALKNIEIGEEITVSYGDNYFGPDNCECLCNTCEGLERNGWTSKAAVTEPKAGSSTPVPNIRSSSQTSNKKRKRDESPMPPQIKSGGLKRLKVLASPSKLQYSWTPPSTSESEVAQEDANDQIEVEQPAMTSPESVREEGAKSVTPQRDGKGRFLSSGKSVSPKRGTSSARSLSKRRKSFPPTPSATSNSSQDSEKEVSAGTSEMPRTRVPVRIKLETVEKTTIETDHPPVNPASSMFDDIEVSDEGDNTVIQHPTSSSPGVDEIEHDQPQNMATLTMTKISTIFDQPPVVAANNADSLTITALPASVVVPSIEPVPKITRTKSRISTHITITPISEIIRVPGDYILTRKLLAQPHDRWVRCHNDKCLHFFLQPNGYQTRRECPRCERHSMLYGFPWPKTDPDARKLLGRQKEKKGAPGGPPTNSKYSAYRRQGKSGKGSWVEGGGDEEERVMDHRTIHRFVMPDEERELTRKGLLVEAEEARKLGDGWQALAKLDGRAQRFRDGEGRESTARESSEGFGSVLLEGEDDEGRRRSNRIVESRVYVNVDMKR